MAELSGAMTSADAARALGTSVRQVNRLVVSGELTTSGQVGRSGLIEAGSVRRRAANGSQRGRAWTEDTAWAAIALLNGDRTTLLDASTRSRLRARLRAMTADEFVRLARRRARLERFWVADSRRDDLRAALALTGDCAIGESSVLAAELGLSAGRSQAIDGYLARGEVAGLISSLHLERDLRGGATVRITDVARQIGHRLALDTVVALDLAESLDVRARDAGRSYLRRRLRTV